MSSEIIAAFVGATFAGILALIANRDSISDSLDSKSGWRKKLFDVASKDRITMDDIYRIRASLRLDKHDSEQTIFSFNWMSNVITDFCDNIISDRQKLNLEYTDTNDLRLDSCQSEIARIYCRYLLKHHWEYRKSPLNIFFDFKKRHNISSKLSAIQTIEKVVEQYNMVRSSSKSDCPECVCHTERLSFLESIIYDYKKEELIKKQNTGKGTFYFSFSIFIASVLSMILIYFQDFTLLKPLQPLLLVIFFIFLISFSIFSFFYYLSKNK